jgi:hypothetical protein
MTIIPCSRPLERTGRAPEQLSRIPVRAGITECRSLGSFLTIELWTTEGIVNACLGGDGYWSGWGWLRF